MAFSKYVNLWLFFLMVLLVASCKSTKTIAGGEVNTSLSAKRIIQNHYNQEANFKTLSGRVKIDYSNGEDEQGVTVNYRMKKDEVIWMSAPLGVVKALITPENVSFYNKLEGEYFEGDYKFLSTYVGIELDFNQLQNILLGNAVTNLKNDRFQAATEASRYILKPKQVSTTLKTLFFIEPKNFRIDEQQLSQPSQDRLLNAKYKYQSVENKVLPAIIQILALEEGKENRIELEFKGVELNRAVNFPYRVPKGYKEINLSK